MRSIGPGHRLAATEETAVARGNSAKRTILVSGMVAGVPYQGGAAWTVLQYLLGFKRLGHEVIFVEQCAAESLRPAGAQLAASENASYFQEVMAYAGLEGRAALLLAGTKETVGLPYKSLLETTQHAHVLINVAGMLTDESLIGNVPVRVYVDLDPAFTQLWQVTGIDMRFRGHTHFATVGQAIGSSGCPVPTCGLAWIGIPPVVVLGHWPQADRITRDALTTVANWRSYGPVEHDGVHYGQKAHSMRELIALPRRTDATFVLALTIHPDEKSDIQALTENGWHIIDASDVARTPAQYREFVRGSRAEFGLAKSGYVVSLCGWFSDRSACYLASGRPVIAQETGFSHFLPTGDGLFAFRTTDEALAAIEQLESDYSHHARAAEHLAMEHFDSDKVLTGLLEELEEDA